MICQFRETENGATLADYIDLPEFYPAGRLDKDSEGLVVLTNSGPVQHRISHPKHKLAKTYWVQVDGVPDRHAIQSLQRGVQLKDGLTLPCQAAIIDAPSIWPRTPPIRYRANIATSWLSLTLQEGRNRQVRRMTAAIGHPTLRLIRVRVGPWSLRQLQPGQWCYAPLPKNFLSDKKS